MHRLYLLGVTIAVVGVVLIFVGSIGRGDVSAGGVIFIGPVPIVFGSGPDAGQLALISVVIGAAMVILFLLSRRGLPKAM